MLIVETIAKIRRAYFVQGKAIKAICRELRVSRKVVRKVLRSEATEFRYEREEQPLPRIGPWQDSLDRLLVSNEAKPSRERPTLIRLCHSRMPFVRAYPRETQEMVFDAHDRAFAFFKGTCTRGIYDNMKTAVETIFVGRERAYNRRFLQMCSHYLVDPVACTPASGWEKGQVENQVGLVRERFFTPRLRVKSYEELNAWLLDQAIAYVKAHRHPELIDQTIWEVFEAERPKLSLSWPVRRLPCGAGVGVEDLPGALRQQQVLGGRERGRTAGRGPCLCRSHRDPPGRPGRRRASPFVWPRRDGVRPLALRAGARPQARG